MNIIAEQYIFTWNCLFNIQIMNEQVEVRHLALGCLHWDSNQKPLRHHIFLPQTISYPKAYILHLDSFGIHTLWRHTGNSVGSGWHGLVSSCQKWALFGSSTPSSWRRHKLGRWSLQRCASPRGPRTILQSAAHRSGQGLIRLCHVAMPCCCSTRRIEILKSDLNNPKVFSLNSSLAKLFFTR